MARHCEQDFVNPALMALYDLGGSAMMSAIKDEIPKYIELTEEDMEPFVSRTSRKESRYRQVVGNITSHHNDTFYSYVVRSEKNILSLTDEGRQYVESLRSSVKEETVTDKLKEPEDKPVTVEYNKTEEAAEEKQPAISSIDAKMLLYAAEKGLGQRPTCDQKMKDTVLELCRYRCEVGKLIGEEHPAFTGSDGKPYMIGHHLIPMRARKQFFPKNLDRPSNIVCLCPSCHDKIHHADTETKRKIVELLYDSHIDTLNDEQIYISLDKLMKFY